MSKILMDEAPVLILGFNRPKGVAKIISSISKEKPKNVLLAVDGPRINKPEESKRVLEVQNQINKINWKSNVLTRFREKNLGLKTAVPDAVSWAIEKFGRVIVIEDDLVPGPNFLSFMNESLKKFNDEKSVGHISGYNLVPDTNISDSFGKYRFSKFPESYAWATWGRCWEKYDPDTSFNSMNYTKLYLSKFEKKVWEINFDLARRNYVSTWAYRWVDSLWSSNLVCVSPNKNIANYQGHLDGTHTRRKPTWKELKPEGLDLLLENYPTGIDQLADDWISKNIFKSTRLGFIEMQIVKLVLQTLNFLNMSDEQSRDTHENKNNS